MIEIAGLKKKFQVDNPKKLSESERKDPRLKGRFFHSVEEVNFKCEKGQVLGLLGPNGAGKTTTLRMLSTALKPDAGELKINGIDVVNQPLEIRRRIGFLSGSTGLYGRLTAKENIEYFGRLHKVNEAELQQRIKEISALLEMDEFLDRKADNLSTGMKQKTAIARSVIHQPEVVILDEPTTGLDIMATQTVLDFIRRLKEQGTPVIFSTHHLGEVEELADRVTVINLGNSVFDGTLAEFKALSATGELHRSFLSLLDIEDSTETDINKEVA
jgi:sodium transport system ATP-binding protein